MKCLYFYSTSVGVISIWTNRSFYYLEFEGGFYGSYASLPELTDALKNGRTDKPFPRGIQTENLNIPDDLSEWKKPSN